MNPISRFGVAVLDVVRAGPREWIRLYGRLSLAGLCVVLLIEIACVEAVVSPFGLATLVREGIVVAVGVLINVPLGLACRTSQLAERIASLHWPTRADLKPTALGRKLAKTTPLEALLIFILTAAGALAILRLLSLRSWIAALAAEGLSIAVLVSLATIGLREKGRAS